LRAVDILYMLTILYQGFDLKSNNTGDDAEAQRWLTYLSLFLALVLTAIELASIVLKWRNDTHISSTREKLKQMFAWLWNFKAEMRIASYIASFTGCLIYLLSEVDEVTGRHSEVNQDLLCFFYAFACYGHFRALMESFFVQPAFPTMGVQLITIQKMFANDVSTFLVFLFVYMFNYFTSMYITFPSEAAANHTDVNIFETLAPFEDWLEAASVCSHAHSTRHTAQKCTQ
jgi:hypothetical protein